MFTDSLILYIQEACAFLLKHRNHFSDNEDVSALPKALGEYFSDTSEDIFLKNIAELTKALHSNELHILHNNDLYAAFLRDTRDSIVSGQIINSPFATAIQNLVVTRTEQELLQALFSMISSYATTPFIVVQSPVALTSEQKKDIQDFFQEKYTLALPFFRVDKTLIGGMRIFVDGKSFEWSYRSHLTHILSTLYSQVV